jgi:exosortase/archaeosortase family protein
MDAGVDPIPGPRTPRPHAGRMPTVPVRAAALGLCLAAFWPVWAWYAARAAASPGEAWALVSLATALAFLLGGGAPDRPVRWLWPAALAAAYAASYPFLPMLGRAAIAVVAVASTAHALFGGPTPPVAAWAMLPLSLPVVATLQFYLGFPLRVATAAAAAALVRMTGFPVVREGTALDWGGTLVLVDAPCSGVRMLWVGLFLAFTLSCVYRLDARRTALAAAGAGGTVLAGNALRASALFYVETGAVGLPSWSHEGVGVVVFAFVAAGILACVRWLRSESPCLESPAS